MFKLLSKDVYFHLTINEGRQYDKMVLQNPTDINIIVNTLSLHIFIITYIHY